MQLVLNTYGLMLKVKNGTFLITAGEDARIVSPKQLTSIAITSGCLISSDAIALAVEYELPFYIFDEIGDAVGCLRSPYFETLATLRRKQVHFDVTPMAFEWIRNLFISKTSGQVSVLKYLKNRRPSVAKYYEDTCLRLTEGIKNIPEFNPDDEKELPSLLMGWEGSQARIYWMAVSQGLPAEWQFQRRSRRPAEDPFNAALNYYYGMLYTIVEQAIFASGLDPHLGMLHVDEYDAPTLAFDLIEPFRPWVDLLLVELFMTKQMTIESFDERKGGWFLNTTGKKILIPRFNDWLEQKSKHDGRQTSHRLHIYYAAAELARRINALEL